MTVFVAGLAFMIGQCLLTRNCVGVVTNRRKFFDGEKL